MLIYTEGRGSAINELPPRLTAETDINGIFRFPAANLPFYALRCNLRSSPGHINESMPSNFSYNFNLIHAECCLGLGSCRTASFWIDAADASLHLGTREPQ